MRYNFYLVWHNSWGAACSKGFSSIDSAKAYALSADLTKFTIV